MTVFQQQQQQTRDWQEWQENHIKPAEAAPLAERQAARVAYGEMLRDIEWFQQCCEFAIRGHYGNHSHKIITDAICNKRMNHHALIGQVVAVVECGCPANFARDAWNGLEKAEQEQVTAAIDIEVASWTADQEQN